MSRLIPSHEHLFVFKKQFATQLALLAFFDYLLGVGKRNPENLVFSKSTGSLSFAKLFPGLKKKKTKTNKTSLQSLIAPFFSNRFRHEWSPQKH
jgi:hypothetical protein